MNEAPATLDKHPPEHRMVITERGDHVDIQIDGKAIYDSHAQGVLPLADVMGRIGAALAMQISETDYAFEDGSVTQDIGQAAVRLAATRNVRCWFLDRAPHEDDEPSGMTG